MEILFVSDYVCPYCLVAKEALKRVLERTGLHASITWQPFELTQEPKPRVDTYHDAHRRAGYQVLVEPCKQMGLDMKLPPNVVPRPYTRLAFEGWHYACDQGCGEAYNDLVYRAYFLDEQDIGDPEILADLAVQAGMEREGFLDALHTGVYTEKEKAAVDYSRNVLHVAHVPTIFLDGRELALQDYTESEMLRLLVDGANQSAGFSFGCGPDGC